MHFMNKHHKESFSYYFIFDRIICVLVIFWERGHFVMLIIKSLRLINLHFWTWWRIRNWDVQISNQAPWTTRPRRRSCPFRKRLMPFSRHFDDFFNINEFFSTKLKKKEILSVTHPASNPEPPFPGVPLGTLHYQVGPPNLWNATFSNINDIFAQTIK